MAVGLNMTAYIYIARLRRGGIQWASVATVQTIVATSPTGRMKQHELTNQKMPSQLMITSKECRS